MQRQTCSIVILLGVLPFAPLSKAADDPREAMIAAHNAVRSTESAPPLVWSGKLAAVAQEWADHLIQTNSYSPRQNRQYGENLFEITGGSATPKMVVDAWAGERAHYNRETNSCQATCGHYTQVVWKNTRTVGCGVARANKREVWVCNYDPPGNVIGEKP